MHQYFSTLVILVCLNSLLFLVAAKGQNNCALKSQELTVEWCHNPMGIDKEAPRFSWQLLADCPQSQIAYQILVASSPDILSKDEGDLWNSGKIVASQQLFIAYQGQALQTATTYYWKLKLWDKKNRPSNWSPIQRWTTGLMDTIDNKSNWIGIPIHPDSASQAQREAAHYLYKRFEIPAQKRLIAAHAYVAGLGLFELYINGRRVDKNQLNPANTNYDKRALYCTYNLTELLSRPQNAIGIVLGNGKLFTGRKHLRNYGMPRLWCQIHLQFEDGSESILGSDTSWLATWQGPVVRNNEYDGCIYDANKAIDRWAEHQMSTDTWTQCAIVDGFAPDLRPQIIPAVEVVETRAMQTIRQIDSNQYIIDFGQNLTGWARLETKGLAPQKYKLRYAERLDSSGYLDTLSLRSAKATDIFISKDKQKVVFEPSFTYHGFRYLELSGRDINMDSINIKACVVHNNLEKTGSFQSSSPYLNQLFSMIDWTLKGNYQQVPVDCPQREERLGWLGDRTASVYGEPYRYDIYLMYKKWLEDIQDAQKESGQLPNLVPEHWQMNKDNVTWPVSYLHIVKVLSNYYGDTSLVRQHYASMQKWMDYIDQNYSYQDYIYVDQYGDWLLPPKDVTDKKNNNPLLKSSAEILASTAYANALNMMIEFANKLQLKADVKAYTERLQQLKKSIAQNIVDSTNLHYGTHSPTELILLLNSGLINSNQKTALFVNLEQLLQGPYKGNIPLGLVGLRYVLQTLSENDRIDLAYEIVNNKAYPSWGYMLEQGATTLWEKWNGLPKSSQNHIMLSGDLLQWLYAYLGGIQIQPSAKAFDQYVLHPFIPNDLDSLHISFHTPRGIIRSDWTKNKDILYWNIQIPLGTRAEVYIPYQKKIHQRYKRNFLKFDTNKSGEKCGVYAFQSGRYCICYKINPLPQKADKSPVPEILITDTLINKSGQLSYRVALNSSKPVASIFYTTDGTTPTAESARYEGPFVVDNYCNLKAVAQNNQQSLSGVRQCAISCYHPEKNGWNYKYYEISTRKLPDYQKLTAVDSGKVALIELKKLKKRKHFWAFSFDAYLKIPQDGIYRFYLDSDDGSRLLIDQQAIVVNDGIHYSTQRIGQTYLKKGTYPIRLEHFNNWSFNSLELLISGPQTPKQKLPISWLFYKKED